MKNNRIFMIFFLVLFISLALIFTGTHNEVIPETNFTSDYEHNYFAIRSKVQAKYSLESRHINIVSRNIIDDIAFVLFTFMDDNYSYIGDLSYPLESEEEMKIQADKVISLNVHPINDIETPFTVVKSMITENRKDYCFYYGWINDMHINEIDFAFSDQSINIETQGMKYYALLRNNNQKMIKIEASDLFHTMIHEYSY